MRASPPSSGSQHDRGTTELLLDGGYTFLALIVAVLLAHCILEPGPIGPIRKLLSTGALRLVGRVSYGLYLYHFPIFFAVHETRLSRNHALEVIASLTLTAVAATLSFVFIERPMLRLKRRFERPGDRVTTASADEPVTGKPYAV